MPKLQVIVAPKSGISYHRLVNAIAHLDMGPEWTIELLWFGEDEKKIDCDVLWYSKYLMTDAKWLLKLKEKGTKIIVDIDDHPVLPANHPAYKQWTATGRDKATIENLKIADLVTCSTMKVQEMVRQYNKNTVVLPNAFPYGKEEYCPGQQQPREKMAFIYSGGSTHYQDVKLMDGKFRKLGSDPYVVKNAEFLLAGYEPQQKMVYHSPKDMKERNNNYTMAQSRGEWDKMAAVFKQTNSYQILPSLNLDYYLRYYDMADVALIPLVDNTWNSYKSILKVCEAATRMLPVICSKVEPYYPELKDYPGILWVENNNWVDPIKWCIKNREEVKILGEQLAERIWKEYDLVTINDTRKQVLNSLIK